MLYTFYNYKNIDRVKSYIIDDYNQAKVMLIF